MIGSGSDSATVVITTVAVKKTPGSGVPAGATRR